jgi:DNA-binding NtrC family response regulator
MSQTILIVDDEPGICNNLAAYLEDEGLQVYTAQSGEEALHRIDAGLGIQTCVMDLRLPGMNGIETIAAIHSRVPTMRFVIHTGSEDEVVTTTLQSAGLNPLPIFRKPLTNMENLAQLLHTYSATA